MAWSRGREGMGWDGGRSELGVAEERWKDAALEHERMDDLAAEWVMLETGRNLGSPGCD